MEDRTEFIRKLALAADARTRPPNFDEWLALMVRIENPDLITSILDFGLSRDCYKWRARAVDFLLDLMNHDHRQHVIEAKAPPGRCIPGQPSGWRTEAANIIVFNYLKDDPESKDCEFCRWAHDFTEEPALLAKTLRTLHLHRFDPFMSQANHPESVVKRFLKRCTMARNWDEKKTFSEIRDKCLTELFMTLVAYDMPDLIYRTDDLALESLKAMVFGPRGPAEPYLHSDPPKNMQEALVGDRRRAAERLVMLTAKREAEDKQNEKERVAAEIRRLEQQRAALGG